MIRDNLYIGQLVRVQDNFEYKRYRGAAGVVIRLTGSFGAYIRLLMERWDMPILASDLSPVDIDELSEPALRALVEHRMGL